MMLPHQKKKTNSSLSKKAFVFSLTEKDIVP